MEGAGGERSCDCGRGKGMGLVYALWRVSTVVVRARWAAG